MKLNLVFPQLTISVQVLGLYSLIIAKRLWTATH